MEIKTSNSNNSNNNTLLIKKILELEKNNYFYNLSNENNCYTYNFFKDRGETLLNFYNTFLDIFNKKNISEHIKFNENITDVELIGDGFVRIGNYKKLHLYLNKDNNIIRFTNKETFEILKAIVSPQTNNNDGEIQIPISFSFVMDKIGNFRVTAVNSNSGIILSFRKLNDNIPDFDTLGLSDIIKETILKGIGYNKIKSYDAYNRNNLELFESSGYKGGMIMVTGTMGSGKTTTLASSIQMISSLSSLKTISIEDPIEYLHHNRYGEVVQLEVGRHIKSQEEGLYMSLRSNATVLVLGEVRSIGELKILLQSSINGCFVLTTYHVPDTVSAIERMSFELNDDVMRQLLASSLIGILNQRIVRSSIKNKPILIYEWLPVRQIKPIVTNIIEKKFLNIRNGIKKNIWINEGVISFNNCLKEKLSLGDITAEEYKYYLDIITEKELYIYG